jgi:hypothetical protein
VSNWQLIITLVTFVLAVFGAGWLNQHSSDKRFDDLNKRFEDLHKRIDDLKVYMDARFSAIETRLDRIERQMEFLLKQPVPR